MWYKFKQILLVILLPFTQISQAQHPKAASCSHPDFDKKVHGLLSYTVPVISAEKAYQQKDKFIFLDTREWEEYSVSHIPQARYMGYDNFNWDPIKNIEKETPIIVYCSIGYRSEKIGQKLKKAGYKNVYNLYGSIFEWVNKGYTVHDPKGKSTIKVHTYNKKWSQWVKNKEMEKVW